MNSGMWQFCWSTQPSDMLEKYLIHLLKWNKSNMNFCFSHQIKLKWTFLARHTSNKMSNLNVAFEESNIIKLNRITIFRIKSTNIKFYNFNQLVKSNQIIKLIFNNQIKSIECSLALRHHNILFKYIQIIWI